MQIKTILNVYLIQVRKAPRTGEDLGKEEPVLAGMETVTPPPATCESERRLSATGPSLTTL